MNFWETFYSLCDKKGKKPNPVGEDIGVSTASITKWKKGATPNAEILLRLADYFNVSVDYLLGRTIEENNNIPSIQINDDSIADNSTNKKNGIIIENFTGNEFISNFIKQFSSLSYSEQLEIMNLVNKKAKAE